MAHAMSPQTKAFLKDGCFVAALRSCEGLTIFRHIVEKGIPSSQLNRRDTEEAEAARRAALAQAAEEKRMAAEAQAMGFMEDSRGVSNVKKSHARGARGGGTNNAAGGRPPSSSLFTSHRKPKVADGESAAPAEQNGFTALHEACRIGDAFSVGVLIRRGAALEAVDKYGRTPLCVALGCGGNSTRIASMLIAAGADVGHGVCSGAAASAAEGECRCGAGCACCYAHDSYAGLDVEGRPRNRAGEGCICGHSPSSLSDAAQPSPALLEGACGDDRALPLYYANGLRVPPLACVKTVADAQLLLSNGAPLPAVPPMAVCRAGFVESSMVTTSLRCDLCPHMRAVPIMVAHPSAPRSLLKSQVKMLFATHRLVELSSLISLVVSRMVEKRSDTRNKEAIVAMLANEEGARAGYGAAGRPRDRAGCGATACECTAAKLLRLSPLGAELMATQKRLVRLLPFPTRIAVGEGSVAASPTVSAEQAYPAAPHVPAAWEFLGDGRTPLHVAASTGNAAAIAALVLGFGGGGVNLPSDGISDGQAAVATPAVPPPQRWQRGAGLGQPQPHHNHPWNHPLQNPRGAAAAEEPFRGGGRDSFHPQQHRRRHDVVGAARAAVAVMESAAPSPLSPADPAAAARTLEACPAMNILGLSPWRSPYHLAMLEDARAVINCTDGVCCPHLCRGGGLGVGENVCAAAGDTSDTAEGSANGRQWCIAPPQGRTPLHFALGKERAGAVNAVVLRLLLNLGADATIRSGDPSKESALHEAAAWGTRDEMALLLAPSPSDVGPIAIHCLIPSSPQPLLLYSSSAAKADARPTGRRAYAAAKRPREEEVCAAGSDGTFVLFSNAIDALSPLHAGPIAAGTRLGCLAAAADRPNGEGSSAVHLATRSLSHGVLRILLRAGCDANAREEGLVEEKEKAMPPPAPPSLGSIADGPKITTHLTPLHIAASLADASTLQALIAAGADAFAIDWRGRTPLHYICGAAEVGKKGDVIETSQREHALRTMLACRPAPLAVKDAKGLTPMGYAFRAKLKPSIIKMLQAAGAT